ncbi:MAG: RluA family pseudouridine synthase [Pseudomonadota bacterium]
MSGVRTEQVSAADAGQRLDRWFKRKYPALKHGELEKLLRTGQIRVDGGRVKANRMLEAGEEIRLPPQVQAGPADAPASKRDVTAEEKAFIRKLVIYEDDHVIALAKPFGLAVQGGAKTTRHIDGMLDAFGTGEARPRLTHRLDRDTGGVLLLGRTRQAAAGLAGAFQRHEVEKVYWALVAGRPFPTEGRIDMPVAKRMVRINDGEQERMVAADDEDAKRALTDYMLVDDANGKVSFLALKPLTGRTHQLRVHCAAMKTPILGDGKYGGPAARLDGANEGLKLFCREMAFNHPKTGKRMAVKARLEGHMRDAFKFFGFDPDGDTPFPDAPPKAVHARRR